MNEKEIKSILRKEIALYICQAREWKRDWPDCYKDSVFNLRVTRALTASGIAMVTGTITYKQYQLLNSYVEAL